MKTLALILTVVGLALGTLLVGWFGFDRVVQATLSVGVTGFLLLACWQLILFAVLGLAWDAVLPRRAAGRAIWARMVRDAAGSLLPFASIGGAVLGARALTLHRIGWPLAAGSTIVDLTTEFLAQVVFAILGLVLLLTLLPATNLTLPLTAAILAGILGAVALVWSQRRGSALFATLARHIGADRFQATTARFKAVQSVLRRLYARTAGLWLAVGLHLLAWIGSGVGTWFAFRLLGADLALSQALAIEALLHVILAMAFMVPGYAGVQEAAYVSLGAMFGVPADLCLGVSLLRRARDVVVGVPVLLTWQGMELRRKLFFQERRSQRAFPLKVRVSQPPP